jgi:ParB/RepB/Spo0J family partition protein
MQYKLRGLFEQPVDAIEMISAERIDSKDRLFAVSLPWSPIEQLKRSVGKTGILSPLHIQKIADDRFRIVMGFRRFLSCQNLGVQAIPCLVREQKDDLALFIEALEDNLATRGLHLLEKAHVLLKLRCEFKLEDQTLMEDFMPQLEIRPDRFHLDRYLDLARLPESMQRSLLDPLAPDIAIKLSKWKDQEQDLFLGITSRLQLGKNKQKQLFAILDELRALTRQTGSALEANDLEKIWHECGAADIERDESLSLSERFSRAFEGLRRLRFPNLTEHEKRYEELKAALKIPPQIHFQAPPYFEGNRIDVGFSFGDSDELLKVAQKLKAMAQTDELREILKLL